MEATPRAEPPGPAPARGGSLGRFEVTGRLGAGTMGVVLRARDPLLGRDVAIKVLRGDALGLDPESARTRLVREAQAMAKLKHPHVVAVYEVDVSGGEVLVVMEHVEGRTLRAFCAEEHRPLADVLRVFVEAGRGLAAVHRAGLVHRDFKPENVLVDADGRARVTDFGLVGLDAQGTGTEGSGSSEGGGSPSALLTRTGALVGTPAYMAPEQHERRAADARADQFAFAVALWEAIAGERPFGGETYEELRAAVLGGELREPPRGVRLPARIRRVLERALSTDRDARYPDMDALLADLTKDRARAARRALLAGAFALAVVAAFAVARRSRAGLCEGGPAKLASVWDDETKARIREAFLETKKPYSEEVFQRVERVLNGRARAWTAMYKDSCEATNVRGEQSVQLLDLRTNCLERRREELRALTALFARGPDGDVLDRAVQAALALPGLEACADAVALAAAMPPPADAATRARVEALRVRLAQAAALDSAGKYAKGVEAALPVLDEARSIGYIPLEAEALSLVGHVQRNRQDGKAAEETLREAARVAARAKDDARAAEAWIDLIHVVAMQQERYDAGLDMKLAAEAAVERAGGSARASAALLGEIGAILVFKGKHKEAEDNLARAVAIQEKASGLDDPGLASLLISQCHALNELERYEDGEKTCQRAVAIFETTLGAEHPNVAKALNAQGNLVSNQGRWAEADALYARAIGILEKALLGDRPSFASVLDNHGGTRHLLGDYDTALQCYRRAMAIREKAYGKEHPHLGSSIYNIGAALDSMGRKAEALPYFERAVSLDEKAFGKDHPRVATMVLNLGSCLVKQGKAKEALPHLRRALAIREKVSGPTSFAVAGALGWIGQAHVAMKDFAGAMPPIERALAIYAQRAADRSNPAELAQLRFTAAQAQWGAGRDRTRALELGKQARDAWTALGGGFDKSELPDVKAWLAERGVK